MYQETAAVTSERVRKWFYQLSQLNYSYKLVEMLFVCHLDANQRG